MKKTERISIANYPFVIDLDAHALLTQYLDSLTRKFGVAKENELVNDIESRIAEILNESIKDKNQVVDIEMVRALIVRVGTVSSIELDSLDTESGVRFSFGDKQETSDINGVFKEGVNLISNVLLGIARFFVFLIMIVLGIGIVGCIIGSIYGTLAIGSATEMLYDIDFYTPAVVPITVAFFLIAIIGLVYRIIDRGRHLLSKWLFILPFAFIGIVAACFATYYAYEIKYEYDFSKTYKQVEYVEIGDIKDFTVEVDYKTENISKRLQILRIKNDEPVLLDSDVYLRRDTTLSNIKIVVVKKAHGASSDEALSRAKSIGTPVTIDSNIIHINNRMEVSPSDWVRGLTVDVYIYYPDILVNVKRTRINNDF